MNKTKVIFRLLTICLFMGVVIPACKKDDMGKGNHGGGGKWIDSTKNHEDSTDSTDSSGNGGGGIDSTDSSGNGGGGIDSTDSSGNGGGVDSTDSAGNGTDSTDSTDNGYGPKFTGSTSDTSNMTMTMHNYIPANKKDAYGRDLYIRNSTVYSWDGTYPATVKSNSKLIRTYSDRYYYWTPDTWWVKQ